MQAASAPYAINLEPQVATELARTGATLLVLRMPEHAYFGVDHHGFSVGPKFMGVKMVPPGAHFISYRAVNKEDGSLSAATGFFWWAQPRDVQVRLWDPASETLVPLPDPEEAERYAAGVRRFDFDAHLAPYNLHGLRSWHELSKHITAQHVARISPVCGNISIMAEAHDEDPHMLAPRTGAEKMLADQLSQGRAKQAARQQQQQQQQQQQSLQADAGMEVDSVGCIGCPAQGPGQEQGPGGVHDSQGTLPGAHGQGLQGSSEMAVGGVYHGERRLGGGDGGGGCRTGGPGQAGEGVQGGGTPGLPPAPEPGMPAAAPPAAPAAVCSSSGRCFFTPLPRFVTRPGLSAAQLTAMNMDKTALLQQVATQHYDGCADGLLGELQFSFVAFVFGQSLDAYAQWKALLLLFLGCEEAALRTAQPLFAQVLHALRVQLEVSLNQDSLPDNGSHWQQQQQQQMHPFGVPMVEELLPDSFLKHALGFFFQMLQEHSAVVSPGMFRESEALKLLLKRALGWEYDLQVLPDGSAAERDRAEGEQAAEDEDGPVVVQDPADLISL